MKIEIYGTHIEPEELQKALNLDSLPKKETQNVLLDVHVWQLIAAVIVSLGSGIVGPILTHELAKRREKKIPPPKVINIVINGVFLSKQLSTENPDEMDLSQIEAKIDNIVKESDENLMSIEFED